MRPLARALLTFAAALAVWLVASPARAAAPLCDKRGAITLAPPPTLQPVPPSVEMSFAPSCGDVAPSAHTVDRGQAPPQIPSASSPAPAAVPGDPQVIPPADPVGFVATREQEPSPRDVHSRLDRPPRA